MFQLNSRPDTYETGATLDGRLVIIGAFHPPWVIAVFFDLHGTFLSVERKNVHGLTKPGWSDSYVSREANERAIALWKAEVGFKEGPIRIKPFFLRNCSIGIEKFPLDLAEYASNPSQYPQDERTEFEKDIKRWKSEGNFVFFWSESYHLDMNGDSL